MQGQTIAILGSGATGVSLALACAKSGLAGTVCDPDVHALERAAVFAAKDEPDHAPAITFAPDYGAATSANLIFDALDVEDRAEASINLSDEALVMSPHAAPLAAGIPGNAVRFVPFQPMSLRHLTEVMRFPATTDRALESASTFATRIGRVPVILPPGGRSVGLHLLDRVHETADALLLEGAILWELDEAMVSYGFDLGFYEAQDLIGLDVAYARRRVLNRPSLIADRAVQEGRIGKKIGWGWYRYPGGGGAVIDPLIEDLIREEAWFAKTPQRQMTDDDILTQLLGTLRDAVRGALEQGRVATPDDMARILVHGLGFPNDKLDALGLEPRPDYRGSGAG